MQIYSEIDKNGETNIANFLAKNFFEDFDYEAFEIKKEKWQGKLQGVVIVDEDRHDANYLFFRYAGKDYTLCTIDYVGADLYEVQDFLVQPINKSKNPFVPISLLIWTDIFGKKTRLTGYAYIVKGKDKNKVQK